MKAAAAGHAGRLVRRLTLIVTIVVAGAALTLALLGLFFDFRSIGKGLDTKLVTIAEVTALGVNGDQFTMFRDPSDAGRPEYEAMREHLLEVLKSQNLAYSYTVILNENKNPQLVVDGSEEAEEIGTEYDHAPELVQMYETGQPTVTPIRNEEPYGDLKTAFAPIRNSQGEIVGAVAVDLAANQIIAELLGSARYFGGMWLIVTLVGLLVGRVVARGIARRVTPLSTLAQALAGGDLTAQVSATQVGRKSDEVDDLRASLLAMQQNLMILVTELRANAGQVVSAVSGMAGAVQSLHSISREADQSMSQVAAGTGEQAANATELAGFFVQFTEGLGDFTAAAETQARLVARAAEEAAQVAEVTEQVVTAARAAAGSAGETTEAAATGTAAVSEAAGAVVQIGHAVKEAAGSMEQLSSRAMHIGEISGTIRDLAEQSSLLALNAAIEAARAGEHGRGFAVVADEVRKLAGRSGQSADEITRILNAIKADIETTLAQMREGITSLDVGRDKAERAQEALAAIAVSAGRTAGEIEQVVGQSSRTAAKAREISQMARQAADQVMASTADARQVAAGGGRAQEAVQSVAAISEETAALTANSQQLMSEVAESSARVHEAVESLTQVARELERGVAQFRTHT